MNSQSLFTFSIVGSIFIGMKRLKDLIRNASGTNRYNQIRQDARRITKIRQQKCERCGYDKHVETCHVKSICDFDENEFVCVVNSNDNLLLLCPNCHWEHDNALKAVELKMRKTCQCGNEKDKYSKLCRICENEKRKKSVDFRKVLRPSLEELTNLVQSTPILQIGKKFGVADNTIRKWCKSYGINFKKVVLREGFEPPTKPL